jgi:hypothetical protein
MKRSTIPNVINNYMGCPTDPLASHDSPNKNGCNLNQSFRPLNVLAFSVNTFLESFSPLVKNTDQDRFFSPRQNPPTAGKSSPELPNAHPHNILLTWPNRKKSNGAKSGQDGGCGAFSILFASRYSRDALAVCGRALSAWTIKLRVRFVRCASRHFLISSSIPLVQQLALHLAPFCRAARTWNPLVFHATVIIDF